MRNLRHSGSTFADYLNCNFVLNYYDEYGYILSGLVSDFNKIGKKDGFVKKFIYKDGLEYAYLPITPSQVESAYEIKNFCKYKGESLHCEYRDEEKKFRINMLYEDESLYPKLGLTEAFERVRRSNGYDDAGMILEIPDNEIPNVWEEHLPIKGFPFKGPEKVWVKKDGVWLR